MQCLENCLEPLSPLWITGQEQTGLSLRVSAVLTTELTAANSNHLWAGQYCVCPLVKSRRDAAEGRTSDSRRCSESGAALSQAHEGVKKANPEQMQLGEEKGRKQAHFNKKQLLSKAGQQG